jgi:hypothetical protein
MKTLLLLVFLGFILSACGGHKNKYTKCPAFSVNSKVQKNSSF